MMKKWITILSGLLVAQLVLAITVNLTSQDYGAFQPEQKLLVFDEKKVDGLRIEDGTDSVVLRKRGDKWLLPENGDFSVSSGSVERLLEKLAAMQKGWPVATTSAAVPRFKVAEEQFERKLTLLSGEDAVARLYVGNSPGFRKVHVRPEDEDKVFAVAFNTFEANAKADDWIDKGVLGLDENEIERIEMPLFVLQRQDGKLEVEGLGEKEQTNETEARALTVKFAGLSIQSLLGTEMKPEYRQDQPELEVNLTRKGGGVLSYRFSKPEGQAYFVLKRSDLDHYFKVAEFTVNPIKEITREKLVQATAEGTPVEASAENPAEEVVETEEATE
jgi:hypothetical protein